MKIILSAIAEAKVFFTLPVFLPEFLTTTESPGYLQAVIPAQQDIANELKGIEKDSTEHCSQFYIEKSFKTALTEHFLIRHVQELEGKPGIDSLAKGLEKSNALLDSWGFSYAKRTNWPLVGRFSL